MIELVAVVISMAVLIALIRLKVSIGVALVVEGLIMVLIANPPLLPEVLTTTVTSERTVSLVLASLTISLLVELYEVTRLINGLSKELLNFIKKPYLIILVVPALMGLLPIAGGALMSAPVVGSVGAYMGLSPAMMAFLNVWFRHTVAFVYPMSQPLVTAATLTGHSVMELAIYQVPIVCGMIIIGLYLMRRGTTEGSGAVYKTDGVADTRRLLIYMSPILFSLAVALLSNPILRELSIYSDYSVAVGGLAGVLTIVVVSRAYEGAEVTLPDFLKSLRSEKVVNMVLSSLGAMLIYYAMLGTGISSAVGALISSSGFPDIIAKIMLPGLLSLTSGSTIVGITSSVPLLASSLSSVGDSSLIYLSSFLFYLASPTHLCLAFTVQYFRENLIRVYKYLLPTTALLFLTAIAYYNAIFLTLK
ncbi:MAG: DUF401 family protein [Zestosphaera sp.]